MAIILSPVTLKPFSYVPFSCLRTALSLMPPRRPLLPTVVWPHVSDSARQPEQTNPRGACCHQLRVVFAQSSAPSHYFLSSRGESCHPWPIAPGSLPSATLAKVFFSFPKCLSPFSMSGTMLGAGKTAIHKINEVLGFSELTF